MDFKIRQNIDKPLNNINICYKKGQKIGSGTSGCVLFCLKFRYILH